jgi:hypothetical protein
MTPNSTILFNYSPFSTPKPVLLANNTLGHGTLLIKSKINDTCKYVPFFRTLYVPNLSQGLLSIPLIMQSNIEMKWSTKDVKFLQTNKTNLRASLDSNNLLKVTGHALNPSSENQAVLNSLTKKAFTYAAIASSEPLNGITYLNGQWASNSRTSR